MTTKTRKPRKKAPAGGIIRESADNTWRTPEWILDCARAYFGGPIPLDPASGPDNPTRAKRYFTGLEPSAAPEPGLFGSLIDEAALVAARRSGLEEPWGEPTWCNPPYGGEIKAWLKKMQIEAARGTTIIALLPCARWEQGYMHATMAAANAVCWIRSRVDFVSSIDGAAVKGNPYASMLLGFCVDISRWHKAFGDIGGCFSIGEIKP